MADNLPTVWERAPHTLAKHRMLETYLKAWVPIMSRQSFRITPRESELLFVDGFAGPGCYSRGEDGSPLLAIKSVLAHSLDFPIPVSFLFIEKDPERHECLRANIQKLKQEAKNSRRVQSIQVEQGDCEVLISLFLDGREKENRQVGPALFFLDQFGFADVSMDLIRRIMSQPLCEVFLYLNWDHMHRFLNDESKWSSISKTYGGEEWKPALGLEHKERAAFMLQTYRKALRAKAGSKFVWQFAMCDEADNLLYWLFFCTNNLRGLEEMKKAMWRVDPSGGFRFSDRDDPSQLRLFSSFTEQGLADEIALAFDGKVVTVGEIKEFVLTQTPEHRFKRSLNILEVVEGRLQAVNPPPGRRRGTFSDEKMLVRFAAR